MKHTTSVTLAMLFTACASTSGAPPASAPSTADYQDTAQAIAASTVVSDNGTVSAGDAIAIRDAVHIARGSLPLGFLRDRDGRVHGNRMGLDHAFAVTCKDAAGAALATCDKTTDSATVDIKISGSFQTPSLSATVDREVHLTITGLQTATATVNGDSSFSFDTSFTPVFEPGVTRTGSFDATATYTAVTVLSQDRDDITGGSVSLEVKGHHTVTGTAMGKHDVDKSFDVHADLTFNADHTATLVLDGTQKFTIDLRTGRISKAI